MADFFETVLDTYLRLSKEDNLVTCAAFLEHLPDDISARHIRYTPRPEGLIVGGVGALVGQEILASHEGLSPFTTLKRQVQPIYEDIFGFCLGHDIGLILSYRVHMAHRDKDFELLLLPVFGSDQETCLFGFFSSKVAPDPRDVIEPGDHIDQSIKTVNFLSFGNRVDQEKLRPRTRNFLRLSGALLSIDGEEKRIFGHDIMGVAAHQAFAARKLNVLAVVSVADLGSMIRSLSDWYNLRLVQSVEEAPEILSSSAIDILLCSENLPDGTGLDVIRSAANHTDIKGAVLLLDQSKHVEDSQAEIDGLSVFSLVRPVGDYSLRKAIEEIGQKQA